MLLLVRRMGPEELVDGLCLLRAGGDIRGKASIAQIDLGNLPAWELMRHVHSGFSLMAKVTKHGVSDSTDRGGSHL